MEREILLTGIGGQGVQLSATVLASAAVAEGRHAMFFGLYSGVMRGGNSDSTIVLADGAITTPPVVSRAWSALVMHAKYWEALRARMRPGGFVVANSSVVEDLDAPGCTVLPIAASDIATELGHPVGGGLVLTGAYAAATGLVRLDSLVAAMAEAMPAYRQQHIPANTKALEAGFAAVPDIVAPAWELAAVGS